MSFRQSCVSLSPSEQRKDYHSESTTLIESRTVGTGYEPEYDWLNLISCSLVFDQDLMIRLSTGPSKLPVAGISVSKPTRHCVHSVPRLQPPPKVSDYRPHAAPRHGSLGLTRTTAQGLPYFKSDLGPNV